MEKKAWACEEMRVRTISQINKKRDKNSFFLKKVRINLSEFLNLREAGENDFSIQGRIGEKKRCILRPKINKRNIRS